MKEDMECPLCNEKVFSGTGNGCRMCGMVLEEGQDFCSDICEEKYGGINQKTYI